MAKKLIGYPYVKSVVEQAIYSKQHIKFHIWGGLYFNTGTFYKSQRKCFCSDATLIWEIHNTLQNRYAVHWTGASGGDETCIHYV
jgi:hypothetical protein